MASEAAGGLRQCLIDLTRADTSGDYAKALQAANKLLRRWPKEGVYAFKCKLIAQIQLGLYDDALVLIKKTPPSQMGECAFEKAYIMYRLEKPVEALEQLSSCATTDFRAQELKAQIFYKLERFQEAYDIFRALLKNHADDFDAERQANYLAVQAQLEALGVKQEVDDDLETFEQLYNASCQQIECEQWDAALKNIDKALEICRETLSEEGASEEEIEDELSIIKVQRAFVLQRMGRRQEAIDIYRNVQGTGPSDISVRATIVNNLPGASDDYNLGDSRKKFKMALQLDQNKLTNRQRRTLMLNNALVLLLSNQREPCRRALDDLCTRFGTSKETKLIDAALQVKLNDVQKAIQLLDDSDMEAELTRIHILINNGHVEEALNLLKGLPPKIRNKSAVVSLIVSSLVALNKVDEAVKELESAIKVTKDASALRNLLDEAAQLETGRGNATKAAVYLEQLAQVTPDDITVQCRLIRAYAEFNQKQAEELSAKVFPAVSNEEVNVDELEESDWILYGEKYRLKKDAKMEVEDTEIVTRKLKNRKRKRKVRLPQNYDPSAPADPERWLPRQERAAYKKKHKKNRDRDIGRGTQGSASANPNVEFTAASPSSPRPVGGPVTEGPRQQRPKQQKQKKKKGAKF